MPPDLFITVFCVSPLWKLSCSPLCSRHQPSLPDRRLCWCWCWCRLKVCEAEQKSRLLSTGHPGQDAITGQPSLILVPTYKWFNSIFNSKFILEYSSNNFMQEIGKKLFKMPIYWFYCQTLICLSENAMKYPFHQTKSPSEVTYALCQN